MFDDVITLVLYWRARIIIIFCAPPYEIVDPPLYKVMPLSSYALRGECPLWRDHQSYGRGPGPGGGGGVLRCCLDGGARLKPPNPYPSLSLLG